LTRVLFLTESFHPTLGGGETHIRRLGSQLAAAGDAVTVLTRLADAAWPVEEHLDGIRVRRVGPPGPGASGKYRMLPAALREALREAPRHDVLVVRNTRVLGVPGLVAARARGTAVVLQPEINGELSGEAFTWGKPWANGVSGRLVLGLVALRNLLLRDADAFVAMSRLIRDEMQAASVPAERIRLLPHGVDTLRFHPATPDERATLRARLGLPQGLLAIYSGRLLRGKGLETLVEALAAPSLPRDVRVVLLGSGEGQALDATGDLRRRVAERGLETRVVFAGRSDRVEDYLRACDLFVFPSLFEALGIALVEAAACGLPAIASRTGGIVDVVDDAHSGLLVPPGDPGALAGALAVLAGDSARRAAMGAAARAVAVSRFDEREVLEGYRALFREVSSSRA
jgi:glycosyltransferase involved in cell wall biosynthesis